MKLPFIDKLDSHMQEVVRGGAVAFVLKGLAAGVAFAFNVLLGRLLGAEGAGTYFLALTVAAIAIVFGSMGFDNVLLRFTAAGAAVGNWAMVKGVYQKGITLSLLASAAAAGSMAILAPWLAEQVFSKSELTSPIRWMSLGVIPMTQLILHAHLLKGLKRIRDSQLIEGLAIHTLALLGLYLLGQAWGVRGAVWAYTLSALLTALLAYWIWHKATPQLQDTQGRFRTEDLLRTSFPLFLAALLSLAMNWTSTFMLGMRLGTIIDGKLPKIDHGT